MTRRETILFLRVIYYWGIIYICSFIVYIYSYVFSREASHAMHYLVNYLKICIKEHIFFMYHVVDNIILYFFTIFTDFWKLWSNIISRFKRNTIWSNKCESKIIYNLIKSQTIYSHYKFTYLINGIRTCRRIF